jgi:hypothetical protein
MLQLNQKENALKGHQAANILLLTQAFQQQNTFCSSHGSFNHPAQHRFAPLE